MFVSKKRYNAMVKNYNTLYKDHYELKYDYETLLDEHELLDKDNIRLSKKIKDLTPVKKTVKKATTKKASK